MPRALDTSLLRMAGRPQPAADADPAPIASSDADRSGDRPVVRRRRTPADARAGRTTAPVEPDRVREALKPTGASLTKSQLTWLYTVEREALREQRRLSHSELVRLAIDRQRQHDMDAVVTRIEPGPPGHATESTFALTTPQLRWLREVKGHALLRGESVSQADVIRAAVDALVGTCWNDLRQEVADHLRPRGRPRAGGPSPSP